MAKFGNINSRAFKDLQKELNKLQDPKEFVENCEKELAARMLETVVGRTTVGQYPKSTGKKGGTLKRGWTALSRAKPIEVVNPVEYASYVEYGHRKANHKGWVEGKFIMTDAAEDIEDVAPKILEKKVKNYLKGVMK